MLSVALTRERDVDRDADAPDSKRLSGGNHDPGVQPAIAANRDTRADTELEAVRQTHSEDQRSVRHEPIVLHARDHEDFLDDEPWTVKPRSGLMLEVPPELTAHGAVG